ncbi:MAG TPA: HAMP domain-containing sensor histidine kinase [Anaeromyxobacteraceae bacterium]|nr:HAMP domain-containing sensor histidine kinase [Anaeromyxobacteraceae bacterium]
MRRAAADTWTPPRGDGTGEPPERRGELEARGLRMAHQLKNPLSAMKALVQLGLRNPSEGASHERLATLEREIDRVAEILASYFSAPARAEETAPGRVHVGALASQALRLVSAQAEGARVRLGVRGDGFVEGDPQGLLEALVNLLVNAIQATAPGGKVEVEVRPEGERIDIVVRDTGSGMPPDTLRRVGTPYFTTRGQGTGLGVALARRAVARHGGALRYQSEPGKGTSATITLPRAAAV